MNKSAFTSRTNMILLLVAFILPVGLAKFALDNQWFTPASTNKGELLSPVVDLSGLLQEQAPKWRLVYLVPAQCNEACENALISIHQVWVALGKESDRAEALALLTPGSDTSAITKINQKAHLKTLMMPEASVSASLDEQYVGILIVDTLNNAMLHYPLEASQQEAVMRSRDILYDMKKLLKLSRIG